jgi:hypothetical protein
MAIGTAREGVVKLEHLWRNLPLNILPRDGFQRTIADRAPREEIGSGHEVKSSKNLFELGLGAVGFQDRTVRHPPLLPEGAIACKDVAPLGQTPMNQLYIGDRWVISCIVTQDSKPSS